MFLGKSFNFSGKKCPIIHSALTIFACLTLTVCRVLKTDEVPGDIIGNTESDSLCLHIHLFNRQLLKAAFVPGRCLEVLY